MIAETGVRRPARAHGKLQARSTACRAMEPIEHDKVLARIVTGMVKDDAELFMQFMGNEGFKRWMTDRCSSCEQAGAAAGTTRSAP